MVMKVMVLEVIIDDGSECFSKGSTHFMEMMIQLMMLMMTMMISMMVMTLTCRSLRTSMSLTGRQTAVLQNITCVL